MINVSIIIFPPYEFGSCHVTFMTFPSPHSPMPHNNPPPPPAPYTMMEEGQGRGYGLWGSPDCSNHRRHLQADIGSRGPPPLSPSPPHTLYLPPVPVYHTSYLSRLVFPHGPPGIVQHMYDWTAILLSNSTSKCIEAISEVFLW